MNRRRARRLLLRLLFQQEFREGDLDAFMAESNFEDPFILETLRGIHTCQDELDGLIEKRVEGWSLERLASVDRNILRLALYELLYSDTPGEVVINEAVELAKRFGTENSAAFVNGILDRTWRDELHPARREEEHG